MENISYTEARILKDAGRKIDVKVTLRVSNEKKIVAHMRDYVFEDYRTAARFLRYITETELVTNEISTMAVAS